VVSISVKPGDLVRAGEQVAVLEAMKMETHIAAPFSGRVREVTAIPHVQVAAGTPLLQLEPANLGEVAAEHERVDFCAMPAEPGATGAPASRCLHALQEIRQLMLGFDGDPGRSGDLLADWSAYCACDGGDEIRELEDEILSAFVDICSLFHRLPEISNSTGVVAPSAESSLFAYLRMLDSRGEGLPNTFLAALRCTLAHYGVYSLDRSSELEETLLRIYKSHARMEQQVSPVLAILERRLKMVGLAASRASEEFRTLLDRIVFTVRGLFPAISDLARELRYRCFDQPLFEESRKKIYLEVEEHLSALVSQPDATGRADRIRALVECPQALTVLFSSRFAGAPAGLRQAMLEVLVSRYYRIRKSVTRTSTPTPA
jgi:hypothetical protein